MNARTGRTAEAGIEVTSKGPKADAAVDYARERIGQVVRNAPAPVLFVRVKLSFRPHRSTERAAHAEAMLDMNGRAVRAEVAAQTMREAVDLLDERLSRQLRDLQTRRKFLRGQTGRSEQGQWRRGDLRKPREEFFPRPAEEAEIVRRKSFQIGRSSPEEAALDMDLLDHDFHLFVDEQTGQDAVVYRQPDEGYAVSLAASGERGLASDHLEVVDVGARPMSAEAAVARLNLSGEPFVVFENDQTGRGNVAYRRYDGNYGLIVPSE